MMAAVFVSNMFKLVENNAAGMLLGNILLLDIYLHSISILVFFSSNSFHLLLHSVRL